MSTDDEQDALLFGAPAWTATRTYADGLLQIYRVSLGTSGRHVQVWWTHDRDAEDWRCFACHDDDAGCPHIAASKRERERLQGGA